MATSAVADVNLIMLFTTWDEILPTAIRSLTPLHQEIIGHLMTRPGRQRPSSAHAVRTWGLD